MSPRIRTLCPWILGVGCKKSTLCLCGEEKQSLLCSRYLFAFQPNKLELTVEGIDPSTGRRRLAFVHLWESNYVFYVPMWFLNDDSGI